MQIANIHHNQLGMLTDIRIPVSGFYRYPDKSG